MGEWFCFVVCKHIRLPGVGYYTRPPVGAFSSAASYNAFSTLKQISVVEKDQYYLEVRFFHVVISLSNIHLKGVKLPYAKSSILPFLRMVSLCYCVFINV